MRENLKFQESSLIERLHPGSTLMEPLVVQHVVHEVARGGRAVDAVATVTLPGFTQQFTFVVEVKSRTSLDAIHAAMHQAKAASAPGESPLIVVPYLAPDRLELLEQSHVSGIDLCGNAIIVVPPHLYIKRTGQPNLFPDSRPLQNPYRGRSAMVSRALLTKPLFLSLSALVRYIVVHGAELSLPQASKAVRALEQELIVAKQGETITLIDAPRLLHHLGVNWERHSFYTRQAFRVGVPPTEWARRLSSDESFRWCVKGESSVSQYTMFSQGGPTQIIVSDLKKATSVLGGERESVRNFAELELLESDEPGCFFSPAVSPEGVRYASRLQTWLELQAGDARQQDAANDLRKQILKDATT